MLHNLHKMHKMHNTHNCGCLAQENNSSCFWDWSARYTLREFSSEDCGLGRGQIRTSSRTNVRASWLWGRSYAMRCSSSLQRVLADPHFCSHQMLMHAIDLGVIITLIRAILRALFELVELLLGIDGRAAMQPPNLRLDSGMSLLAVMGLMVKGTNYAYYVDYTNYAFYANYVYYAVFGESMTAWSL